MFGLRQKLALAFGGLLAILIIVSVLAIVRLDSYSQTLETIFRENYDSVTYGQTMKDGVAAWRVGMFQTVWVRDPKDGVWRVLFDGSATTGQNVDDRAAADRWVEEQPMSDCAPS